MVPGFQPQWNARQGAQELYEAYRTIGLTKEDIQAGRYIRIHQIQRLLKSGEIDRSLRRIHQNAPATVCA